MQDKMNTHKFFWGAFIMWELVHIKEAAVMGPLVTYRDHCSRQWGGTILQLAHELENNGKI